jgi:hypothetical protein
LVIKISGCAREPRLVTSATKLCVCVECTDSTCDVPHERLVDLNWMPQRELLGCHA